VTIKFKKFHEKAIIPRFGNDDKSNAAVDLYACLPYGIVTLAPGESASISVGVGWEPCGGSKYAMLIQSRSGTAFKEGIEASNAGVIDHSYRGEIKVKVYNNGKNLFTIEQGNRIAQGIILDLPYIKAIEEVAELGQTQRGNSGFGSTRK